MESYKTLVKQAEVFLYEACKFESKPTKASSKRLRDAANDMKKSVTAAKKDLMENDKTLGKNK